MLLGGAVVWSTFTLLTPAMAGNLPALLATRAAMGFGEGVTFPAISNLFAKCAPLPLYTAFLFIKSCSSKSCSGKHAGAEHSVCWRSWAVRK